MSFPSRPAGLFDLELAPTLRAGLAIDQGAAFTSWNSEQLLHSLSPVGESWLPPEGWRLRVNDVD